MKLLYFALILHDDERLVFETLFNFEGPLLNVFLDSLVAILSPNESLNIIDSVMWILEHMVFG
jgi:hypothetical protein